VSSPESVEEEEGVDEESTTSSLPHSDSIFLLQVWQIESKSSLQISSTELGKSGGHLQALWITAEIYSTGR